ncbi:hypothetical protein KP509_26G049400 [Ceratopteris richardii]|nr:hypothetical protein KP509_26G049400 [Ceratopteris richardii]
MERRRQPETIDVRELMKGLDDDEGISTSAHRHQGMDSSSYANQTDISRLSPSDGFVLEPSDELEMRSGSSSGMRLSESLGTGPSNVKAAPQWLSSFPTPIFFGMMSSMAVNPGESLSGDLPLYSKPGRLSSSTRRGTFRTSDVHGVSRPMRSTQENLTEPLQKPKSSENHSKKEMKQIFTLKDGLDAVHSKGVKMGFNEEMGLRPREGVSLSTPTTPSFAESVSLMKWFKEDARISRLRRQQKRTAAPGYETNSTAPSYEGVSPTATAMAQGTVYRTSAGSFNDRNYAGSDVPHPRASASYQRTSTQQMRWKEHREQETRRPTRLSYAERPVQVLGPAFETRRGSNLDLEDSAMSSSRARATPPPQTKVVLYSSSSKVDSACAYEECNVARAIIVSIVGDAAIEERIISEHPEYEQELKKGLNTENVQIPTVYANGRYIAGLDDLMHLYKKGILTTFLSNINPYREAKTHEPCICRGGKFIICPACKGKRQRKFSRPRARMHEQDGHHAEDVQVSTCRHCSGTGLIKCPNCLVHRS